jgi:hypothetical protein
MFNRREKEDTMAETQTHISSHTLRTPRAAAIAGIIFAIFQITSLVLLRVNVPASPLDQGEWLAEGAGSISFALSLMPFSAIAFLWFMGVLRDRVGHMEDQFFSTLHLGSGLLYLGLTLAAVAIGGGLLTVYAFDPDLLLQNGVYIFGRATIYRLNNDYAIRMAGMHMIVLGTIWVRTQVMPRWLALVTYGVALVLLISVTFTLWLSLVFPAWVFVISLYILILNYHFQNKNEMADGMTLGE